MANAKTPSTLRLPPNVVQQLKTTQPDVADLKAKLEALKDLGFDTKPLEEKLTWTDKAISTLLKNFS